MEYQTTMLPLQYDHPGASSEPIIRSQKQQIDNTYLEACRSIKTFRYHEASLLYKQTAKTETCSLGSN